MGKRGWIILAAALAVAGAGIGLWRVRGEGPPDLSSCAVLDRPPRIRPDYADVVIPPNIAPLNFVVGEPGTRFHVRIAGEGGPGIEVTSRGPCIRIPLRPWKALLGRNRGRDITVDVAVRDGDGRWARFQTVTNRIAEEEIDPYLSYRLINSAFFWSGHWLDMCMVQRNIETFDRSTIFRSDSFKENVCVNCHMCQRNDASLMVMQLRGQFGSGMLLVRDGRVTRLDSRVKGGGGIVSLVALHPHKELAAFTTLNLGFLPKRAGISREVFQYASDVGLYRFDTGEFLRVPKLSSPDHVETDPAWSGDGKWLYYCRTKVQWPRELGEAGEELPENYREIRYDLMRIAYDPETGAWGEPETVLSAEQVGKSIVQPSVSPDGRFVVVCMADYGVWPVVRPEADLYLIDTRTREYRRMACNSDACESTHRWSSNGRWMVFMSRRNDGIYNRLYFTHIDENGRDTKAVELPQKDPLAHESLLKAYSLPHFMTEPMPLTEKELIRAIYSQSDSPARKAPAKEGRRSMY